MCGGGGEGGLFVSYECGTVYTSIQYTILCSIRGDVEGNFKVCVLCKRECVSEG